MKYRSDSMSDSGGEDPDQDPEDVVVDLAGKVLRDKFLSDGENEVSTSRH